MLNVLAAGLAFLFGYLAGSIPSGVIVSALGGAADPRTIGSGNIGATNVLRSGRKGLAALTLICDALKGTIAVLVAAHFDTGQGPVALALVAAGAAFLGHLYPVFLGFKGGKGVATFLGCLIALAWPAALAFVAIWVAVVAATRFSSAGALAASAASPMVFFALGHRGAALLYAGLAVVLWIKHRENIQRLLAGTENKVGAKS
jgi:glycerol-3-phosphate acyltransferase PlsY